MLGLNTIRHFEKTTVTKAEYSGKTRFEIVKARATGL